MSRAKKKVQELRPIDDAFFEKLIEDKEVCEEILRVILEDSQLEVLSVTPQSSFKNLWGRSVRLDAFCRLKDGKFCNIEVQKSDNDNHVKRVRYNASCITANNTESGANFVDVPDVTMVYIYLHLMCLVKAKRYIIVLPYVQKQMRSSIMVLKKFMLTLQLTMALLLLN